MVADHELRELCASINLCVSVFDTLAATTLHTIPALSDQHLAVVCEYVAYTFIHHTRHLANCANTARSTIY